MKRWLVRIFVFLFLGAIVNVAVAWGCAVSVDVREAKRIGFAQNESASESWHASMRRRPGVIVVHSQRLSFDPILGPPTVLKESQLIPRWLPWLQSRDSMVIDARGWPMPALASCHHAMWRDWSQPGDAHDIGWGIRTGLEPWSDNYPMPRVLPLRPIWPGFAVNTIFYAAILWLILFMSLALRKRRRIKRGLCPKCAYDLRTSASATCPECGNIFAS